MRKTLSDSIYPNHIRNITYVIYLVLLTKMRKLKRI
ncbi:hypothetical protein HNR51_002679 [Methylorubrum thiocyanatum]|uniref:Uncharacterized protein n=1 Tax=Methylorubrum thiocyanatum TaxID=47958 RepID=A0AA40S2Y9_9HYPH|nr:hypothetical protein [Methylorubrum thiocyanatum]GJE81615.1 hypothetical protein CJNNKLLH_2968 [Methylorubrum thiocyanatum]